ncbi:MAG: alanine--tRNA ligase [Phycisphaerales bacterium JB037]
MSSSVSDSSTPASHRPPVGLPAAEVRRRFIEFFLAKGGEQTPDARGHAFVPSSAVVPLDDPTLLFTNAGMNQFKPIFLGQVEPGSDFAKLHRAVNSQKCIRAGGKHNDLEDVGFDTYHHTFFEMLGNWSFGDYFKLEAIDWAFELLTSPLDRGGFGVDPRRLYATYFGGDESKDLAPDHEARELWLRHLPPERVLPGDMKDNFWEMGDTGPCGPCSEIHYDRIGGRNAAHLVNHDDPDVLEVWNLVFIQYDRQSETVLRPLPAKHVDTGMGLERIVSVLQDKRSNYDTDVFMPLFAAIRRETNASRGYEGKLGDADEGQIDTAYRVIADHLRTLSFAIADGAVPSNEGRGYVLRRVLRRAVRFGRQMLGAETGFLSKLVPDLVKLMGEAFPELRARQQHIIDTILEEEESFGRTLDKGLGLFAEICGSSEKRISGEDAFKLYDTYGFPLDLTQLMAKERGLTVDVAGYERCMEEQRARSRAGAKGGEGDPMVLSAESIAHLRTLQPEPTDDHHKYENRPVPARVRAIWNGSEFTHRIEAIARDARPIGLVFDKTNFYAEAGGQIGDAGRVFTISEDHAATSAEHTKGEFHVTDTRAYAGYVLHIGHMVRGELRVNDRVELHLDRERRARTASNHTATHLLNLGLRAAVGEGCDQRGSSVTPDQLRFDFSSKPVTDEQLRSVERTVRHQIESGYRVHADAVPLDAAMNIQTLRAVFGEKYPDPVRVVSIGVPIGDLLAEPKSAQWSSHSVELCGGTHVASTAELQAFAITSETGVAKGTRRIEAITGVPALAARQAAEGLAAQIAEAAELDDEALAGEVPSLNAEIDSMTLSVSDRADLRAQLEPLLTRIKAAQKARAKEAAARAIESARSIGAAAREEGKRFVVARLDAGEDRQAIGQAMKLIQDACPDAAVIALSADEKVAIVAAVPDDLVQQGLKAGDWVRVAAEACGGKGGGKPNQAQGGGTDPGKLADAVDAAERHAASVLGG